MNVAQHASFFLDGPVDNSRGAVGHSRQQRVRVDSRRLSW
jgi:hypothetical protein